jgi:hypothetical protein
VTVALILGPRVDAEAIDLVLDLERRGYDIRIDGNGQPLLCPTSGLSWRDADRWRRHRADIVALIDYADSPPSRPWS